MNKVVLIGCGNVGMSYVYSLLNQRTNVHTVALIDLNEDRVKGEVLDLSHGLPFAPSNVEFKAGSYADCKDATIVVIAAGANQAPGETRMDLINKNSKIFKDIVGNVMANGFNGIFLVATNPLDVMTYLTFKYSGLDSSKVLGSGTTLDTARLRYLVGSKLNINPKNVHGYVIGEHGDTEFVPWSIASAGALKLTECINPEEQTLIEDMVRKSAYEIINLKGATYYGIGMCLVRITNAILSDENTIMTVSTYDKERDCYYGYPSILNSDGVKSRTALDLKETEKEKLEKSIQTIKEAINKVI